MLTRREAARLAYTEARETESSVFIIKNPEQSPDVDALLQQLLTELE